MTTLSGLEDRFCGAAIATVTLTAIALSACGLGEPRPVVEGSPKQQIRAVAERYNAAIQGQDPSILCREVLPPSRRGDLDRCEAEIGQIMALPDEPGPFGENDLGNPDENLEVVSIELKRGFANVEVKDDGMRSHLTFLKEQGRWWLEVFD